eukprot:Pgem_evm2s20282
MEDCIITSKTKVQFENSARLEIVGNGSIINLIAQIQNAAILVINDDSVTASDIQIRCQNTTTVTLNGENL